MGKNCTKGDADMCFRYIIVSSYLMIRKVDDQLFYLKSLTVSSCIYFPVVDKEGPAVNCEKNLRKRKGKLGGGGRGEGWQEMKKRLSRRE